MNDDKLEYYTIEAVVEMEEPHQELKPQTFWERVWRKQPESVWTIQRKWRKIGVTIGLNPAQTEWVKAHPEIIMPLFTRNCPYHSSRLFKLK